MRGTWGPLVVGLALSLAAAGMLALPAAAQQGDEVRIVIRNHRFEPDQVRIPAGKRVKLVVENQDATPEEFESHALHVEKIIPGGATASLFVGPLKPGSYPFVGEFNEDTAKGTLIAE